MPKLVVRLSLALAASALAVVCFEGVLSLVFRRTLRRDVVSGPLIDFDSEALQPSRDAGSAAGPYCRHPDPRVAYVLRADADLDVMGLKLHSSLLGLRSRPGDPAPPDAFRIAVVGDSIAFGIRLADDQTLAARIEWHLNAARGADAPPIAAYTVALPAWNQRNSISFLLDHLNEIDPDLVVFVPVANDLADSYAVSQHGTLVPGEDPESPDRGLLVDQNQVLWQSQVVFARAQREGRRVTIEEAGIQALNSGVTPLSNRRFAANAESLALLVPRLQAIDARLAIVSVMKDEYCALLRARTAEACAVRSTPPIPWIDTVNSVPADKTLGDDPHPNAEAMDAIARLASRAIVAKGLVGSPGSADPSLIPLPDSPFSATPESSDDDAQLAAAAALSVALARASSRVDFESGRGVFQVYGGFNPNGSATGHTAVALRRGGARLDVAVAPIFARPDLYPMQVRVEVDGIEVGTMKVESFDVAKRSEGTYPLPDALLTAEMLDVTLIAERFGVMEIAGERRLVAFVPLFFACE